MTAQCEKMAAPEACANLLELLLSSKVSKGMLNIELGPVSLIQ